MAENGKFLGWMDDELANSNSRIGATLREILAKHAAYNQPPLSHIFERYTEQEIDDCLSYVSPFTGQSWAQHCVQNDWTLEEALRPIDYKKALDDCRGEWTAPIQTIDS